MNPVARSGGRASPTEAKNITLTTYDGSFGVDSITAPSTVPPGTNFSVGGRAFNGFSTGLGLTGSADVCADDANPCSAASLTTTAPVCYQIIIEPSWTGSSSVGPGCLGGSPIGVGTEAFSVNLQAPNSTGSYTVSVELNLPGSGTTKVGDFGISVTGGTADCTTNSDCPDGKLCNEFGDCVDESEGGAPGPNGNNFIGDIIDFIGSAGSIVLFGLLLVFVAAAYRVSGS